MNNSALIDTNILVYSVHPGSPYHSKAKKLLEEALPTRRLAISLQNITEFFAITTSKKYLSNPFSVDEAVANLEIFAASCQLILPSVRTKDTFFSLLRRAKVTGQDVHDVHLAATMLDNGINTIYTADPKIFKALGVEAIDPFEETVSSP